MNEFNTILDKIEVASSYDDVRGEPAYQNISGAQWLGKLRECPKGIKKGLHWIRTTLNVDHANQCLRRKNDNAASLAYVLLIDCDKRISPDGQEVDGAPDPLLVSNILKAHEIAHILHGSYSHYMNEKGNRYRILLMAQSAYNKEQLAPTVESIVAKINIGLAALEEDLLANAVENSTWAQGWYYPRQPTDNSGELLYLEHMTGQLVEVIESLNLPAIHHLLPRKSMQMKPNEISVIDLFNEQKNICDVLIYYGYKQVLPDKWLSPNSSSGVPGITVRDNKFFTHHADVFNDGYWHDCWDLWQKMGNLSMPDAITQAAKNLYLPDGRTVDEHNKNLVKNILANIKFNEYQPFNNDLLPVEEIPYKALPDNMEHFIKEQSEIRGCPPDFILVSVLSRMGVMFAGKIKIALMRHTNWHVTPNFFWMMVGPPSSGKTNALEATAGPIKSLSEIATVTYEKNTKIFEQEHNLLKRQINSVMKGMDKENAKVIPDSEQLKIFEARLREIQNKIDILYTKKPKCKVYTVNKTTFEKLILVAKENPEGVMLELDEVAPLFIRLSKDENCEERGFYLTGYNGSSSYSYRTIARGEDLVERVVISIIGGTQPGKIERVVNEMKNNITNDGFLQRFQGVVYPNATARLAQDKHGEADLERQWSILLQNRNFPGTPT